MATKRDDDGRGKHTFQTANEVKNASPESRDYWMVDKASTARGSGRLVLRVSRSGSKRWYFKYATDGRYQRVPLGEYAEDGDGAARLTLKQARLKADELAALHSAPETRDVRAALQAKENARQAAELEQRKAAELAARAAEQASAYTLKRLCGLYVERLEKAGKPSARDSRNIFKNWVDDSAIAAKPARDVSARDVTELLRRLTEAGKGRTAGKLRAFLRAAYALALKAELNADAPAGLLGFDLTANPAAPTDALARYNKPLERTLSVEQLAGYIKRVAAWPGVTGDALRLHLLTGGQRPAQLLRVTLEDFDGEGLTLRDAKGNRQAPRLHYVPLVGEALGIVERMKKQREALGWEHLFTSAGDKHTRPETLTWAVADIVKAERERVKAEALEAGASEAVAKKRAAALDYQLRDVRRTVETMLAANGVSKEVRGHLQSHGLGGVQSRHYDRHDYLREKTQALETWHRILAEVGAGTYQAGNVRRLRAVA